MSRRTVVVGAALLSWVPLSAAALTSAGFEPAYSAAMTAYYAALRSSAVGDADSTTRNLVVLKARWTQLTGTSQEGAPAWCADTVNGEQVLARVARIIEDARDSVVHGRHVADAHAKLEGLRLVLHDARARHGVRGFDDILTEYHEMIERLTNRVGLQNEIALTADDFASIADQTQRAQALWRELQTSARPPGLAATRAASLARTEEQALSALQQAAATRDAASAARGAKGLRDTYFALLTAISTA